MRARAFGLTLVALALATPASPARADSTNQTAPAATLHRAVSASRQFTAYAPTALWAPALCVFAERVKRQWLTETGLTDAWRDPIVLVVRMRDNDATPAGEPAVRLDVFQTDIGLKYQISCHVPPPPDGSDLLAALVEALCAEHANRARTVSRAQPYVAPALPAWLVHGLTQRLHGRAEQWLAVTRRSLDGGRPPTARSLLDAPRLPATEADRQLFQSTAWLLCEGLLALPDGSTKLQEFLTQLGASKSATNAFWTAYRGDFATPVALEKWWALRLTTRAGSDVAQNLTTAETLRQLDEVLRTRVTQSGVAGSGETTGHIGLPGLPAFAGQDWLDGVLGAKLNSLRALRAAALPADRPLLDAYAGAIQLLREGKRVAFTKAVAAADAARGQREDEARAVRDYLDQAERVHAPEDLAGLFDGYFETLQQFEELDKQRRSPISDYLDRFDR
jgi:hypothetical protein